MITPKGIGVATTTLTVSDTPGISEEFKAIVYRPVTPRTNTETVHVVDPEVETTLTSSDGRLSVTFPAGAKDQFYQVAIDALSNDCGKQSPVGERRTCVLVDLFDLGAESIEESLDVTATLSVSLDQQQYNTVQADLDNDDFTMWKGHGPSDTSWEQVEQCAEPRGKLRVLQPGPDIQRREDHRVQHLGLQPVRRRTARGRPHSGAAVESPAGPTVGSSSQSQQTFRYHPKR